MKRNLMLHTTCLVPVLLTCAIAACTVAPQHMTRHSIQGQTLADEIETALRGYKVIFASESPHSDGADIWLSNVDGSHARNLTSVSGGYNLYPEWGPKAQFVYYTSNAHNPENGAMELYQVNVEGSPRPQQLSNFGREVRSIAVSPDNQLIALGIMSGAVAMGDDLSEFSSDLFILPRAILDKALARKKTVTLDDLTLLLHEDQDKHVWHEQPHWRPSNNADGNLLAYTRTIGYDTFLERDQIWLIRADGSNNTLLADGESMPRWTSDGQFIATHGMSVISANTSEVRTLQIDNLPSDAGAASLSPDGQFVLFENDDHGRKAGIAKVSYLQDGFQNPYILLNEALSAYEPRWSPIPLDTNQ
ncbi:MAG: hypothetical protein OIF55_05420 [Amphritea sp.]|nr:hypothetical protein [Amphritea sp.]